MSAESTALVVPETPAPASNSDSSPATAQSAITNTLSHLSRSLLGSPSLQQGAMLMVAGTAFELFRRYGAMSLDSVMSSFVITGSFHERHTSYRWIELFLERQPFYQSSGRRFELLSHARRHGRDFSQDSDTDSDDSDCEDSEVKSYRWPAEGEEVYFIYKNHICHINHTKQKSDYGRGWAMFNLTIYSRDASLFDQLVSEAKALYLSNKKRRGFISTFIVDYGDWEHLRSKRKRPIESVILPEGIKDALLEDAKSFIKSKPWYQSRGIPFRRGYCLYGRPGAGKSSTVEALAGELNLDIYILSLSDKSITDTSLLKILNSCPEKCVVCIEDIDCAFADREQQEKSTKEEASAGITLSGLLNALDSSGASESRLLFCTTNYIEKLDPALKRPGRLDCMVEYRDASKDQARALFQKFFPVEHDAIKSKRTHRGNVPILTTQAPTGPTTQAFGVFSLLNVAIGLFRKDYQQSAGHLTPKPFDDKIGGISSGKIVDKFSQLSSSEVEAVSTEELEELSKQFAEAVPHERFSIASLQGYCLLHKNDPKAAVAGFADWIASEEAREAARLAAAAEKAYQESIKLANGPSSDYKEVAYTGEDDRDSHTMTVTQTITPDNSSEVACSNESSPRKQEI